MACTDTTRATLTLTVLSLIYFVENFDRYFLSVSPIPYIDYSSYEYALLAGTLFAVFYTTGGVIVAILGDSKLQSTSKVAIISVATVIFSLAFAMSAFAKTFAQQAVIRVIMGISQSVVTPFSAGIIGQHFSSSYLGVAFGIYNIGVYLAFSSSLSIGTLIYDVMGWQPGYIIFGLLGIFLAIITPCLVSSQPSSNTTTSPSTQMKKSDSGMYVHAHSEDCDDEVDDSDLGDKNAKNPQNKHVQKMNHCNTIGKASSSITGVDEDIDDDLKLYSYNYLLEQDDATRNALHDRPNQNKNQKDSFSFGTIIASATSVSNNIINNPNSAKNTENVNLNKNNLKNKFQPSGNSKMYSLSPFDDGSSHHDSSSLIIHEDDDKDDDDDDDVSASPTSSSSIAVASSSTVTAATLPTSASSIAPNSSKATSSKVPPKVSPKTATTVEFPGNREVLLAHKDDEDADGVVEYELFDATSGEYSGRYDNMTVWQVMSQVYNCWIQRPIIIFLSLTTGIRLGGGYIWAVYTAIYFCELLTPQPFTESTGSSSSSSSSSNTQILNISSVQRDLGNIINPSTAPCLYSYNSSLTDTYGDVYNTGQLDVCPPMYPYCMDNSCYKLADAPWLDKGMSHRLFEENIWWVPLFGSAFGSLLGGILADRLVRMTKSNGSRAFIAGIGTLMAVPMVCLALSVGSPWCFLLMCASGLVGEVYLSQSLALLTDTMPPRLLVTSTSIFMFFITIIGGNTPVLVPLVRNYLKANNPMATFEIQAAQAAPDLSSYISGYNVVPTQLFVVTQPSALELQHTLTILLAVLYIISGLLYLVIACLLKKSQSQH